MRTGLNQKTLNYINELDSKAPICLWMKPEPSSDPRGSMAARMMEGAEVFGRKARPGRRSGNDERVLRLSEDFPESGLDHPEDRSSERSLVMQDLENFTRELEIASLGIEETYRNKSYLRRFERGDVVAPHGPGDEKYFIFEFKSGADTHFGTPVRKEVYDLYKIWKRHRGFPDTGQAGHDDPETRRLERFLGRHHILLQIGDDVSPQQIRYIHSLFEMLPAPLFATKFLRSLRLGGERRDASKFDCYDKVAREVSLFSGLMLGPRRKLLGYLLHGLGYGIAEQFVLESNEEMQECFDILRNGRAAQLVRDPGNVIYPLEWAPGSADSRRMYLESHVSEFIAEHVLIYRVEGSGLRAHIATISNSRQREAYLKFYHRLREHVFEGKEY
jgi:hypothetical protein